MTNAEWQKLQEVVLYVLDKTQDLDYYRVFKILYFAEQEHLKNYGTRIIGDDFCALPHGPVPSKLYDAIKENRLSDILEQRKGNVIVAKRRYNADYLSLLDCKSLDKSITENATLSFTCLKDKSHDTAWKATPHCRTISIKDIASAAGASTGILVYIEEQEEIDKLLR